MRRATFASQKDGFVGCFLREPNAAAGAGETDAGAFAEQPWNWQKAYAATRILTDEWVSEVDSAPDPLRLRVFEEQYEKAISTEIPIAIDLVKRAQFFLLVLDEDSDEAKSGRRRWNRDGRHAGENPHYARVHLWELGDREEVVRVRRAAEAGFVFAGEHEVRAIPETLDAMKRQVGTTVRRERGRSCSSGSFADRRRATVRCRAISAAPYRGCRRRAPQRPGGRRS